MNQMANQFKILVEIDGQKYTVLVKTDFKLITFRKICNEINCQTKQNVSFESHVFELFDRDFEEYVIITDKYQLVDNHSKIRIKINCKIEDNSSVIDREFEKKVKALNLFVNDNDIPQDKTTNSSGSHQIPSSTSSPQKIYWNNLSENQRKDYKSFKNLIRNVINLKDMDNRDVTISLSEDNSDDWESVCPNGQTFTQTKDKAINYLDLELSPIYKTSSISKVLSYKTIVIEVHNQKVIGMRFFFQDYKAIQQLLQLIDANRHCFEINRSSNSVDSPKWKLMSDQMVVNAFQDWTPPKCRDGFINALELYRKSLERCPDFETADAVNPLFYLFHIYDMKYVLAVRQFQLIRDLRINFQQKCTQSLPNTDLRQTFNSDLSLVSMNADFNNQKTIENKDIIERSKLMKMNKMTDFDINYFKVLSNSVQTIVKQFGPISKVKNFWELVSNQMKQNGYKDMDPFTARNVFTEYISDYYALLLIRSPDYKSAQEVYPLFAFIHAMDLSQCLSYTSFAKIKELRTSFAKKCFTF